MVCNKIIEPTEKLKKYEIYMYITLIIIILLFLADSFYIHKDKAKYNLLLSITMFETLLTRYYKFLKIFYFLDLIVISRYLTNIGLIIQNSFSIKENKIEFLYIVFCTFFYCLCIVVLFEPYKEMRAIFLEEYTQRNDSNSSIELSDYKELKESENKE